MVPHPGASTRTHELRPLNLPNLLIVEVDAAGEPAVIVRHGRRLAVTAIQEVWRIDDEWWRESISRRYYLLVLEQSIFCTVYQDLTTKAWYEQHA